MTNVLLVAIGAAATAALAVLLRTSILALTRRALQEIAEEIVPKPEPQHGLIVGRVVIVNIKGGLRALVGVLVAVNGTAADGTVVLAQARTLPGREKILGEAVVPRDQIDWLQSDVPPSLLEDVTE